MTYSIPSDEKVIDAIFYVMYRRPQVRSQREMVELVSNELNRSGGNYRISGQRIRRLAIKNDMLVLSISYNESEGELPTVCPVCGGGMTSVMNSTLDGRTIEVCRRCDVCPYTIGTTKHVPGRYSFSRKRR